jgi:hypothetical protein
MAVGNQITRQQIDQMLSSDAVALRNVMWQIANHAKQVVALGTAGLEALAVNPYTAADAATVLQMFSYLSTFPAVYEGTQFQGTTGSNGIQFDFDNALCELWAGS